MNDNGQQYFGQTIRRMADHYSQLASLINNMNMNTNGGDMNTFSAQMSVGKELSIMRMEYNEMMKEQIEMRKEMERCRKQNEYLSLELKELQEESLTNKEAKKKNIKDLVEEHNHLRAQIYEISTTKK